MLSIFCSKNSRDSKSSLSGSCLSSLFRHPIKESKSLRAKSHVASAKSLQKNHKERACLFLWLFVQKLPGNAQNTQGARKCLPFSTQISGYPKTNSTYSCLPSLPQIFSNSLKIDLKFVHGCFARRLWNVQNNELDEQCMLSMALSFERDSL